MNKITQATIYFYSIILLTLSCDEEKNKDSCNNIITNITDSVSMITTITAACGGNIVYDCYDSILMRGVCWSNSEYPTIQDNCTSDGMGSGKYSSYLTGLSPKTTYYVRAYAILANDTIYGSIKDFTTTGFGETITDIDGNVYRTIQIGSQVWMVENLKTTRYRNGVSIPNVTDNASWNNLTSGAYCDYSNNSNNSNIYGRLYNWYVVNNINNVAPNGWHIPSDNEWFTLVNYLGGEEVVGGKLKESGYAHWFEPNEGATNETAFTALPSGFHGLHFYGMYSYCFWWSSTEYDSIKSWARSISYWDNTINNWKYDKYNGHSIRCIKDN